MRLHSEWRVLQVLLVLVDALALSAAVITAVLLASAIEIGTPHSLVNGRHYAAVGLLLVPGLLVLLWARGAYAREHLCGGHVEYTRVMTSCSLGVLLLIAASYLYGSTPLVSRRWLLFFWGSAVSLLVVGRFLARRLAYRYRRYGRFIRRVLIAGASDEGVAIAGQLHGPSHRGVSVVGFLHDDLGLDFSGVDLPCPPGVAGAACVPRLVGHPRNAKRIADELGCDLVVMVPSALSWESQQLIAALAQEDGRGAPEVRIAPTQYDLTAGVVQAAPLGNVPLVRLRSARIVGVEAIACDAVDRLIALGWLVVTGPALLYIVALAWARGDRSLFVYRSILARDGRPVTIPLLRESVTRHLLLRGAPALVGVIRGDLALVGPRPIAVADRGIYEHWLGVLLAVRPGLTGPWRLAPQPRSALDQVLVDMWWVRNWSLGQHLWLLGQMVQHLAHRRRIVRTLRLSGRSLAALSVERRAVA